MLIPFDALILIMPLAFIVMLVASVILFRRTRQRHFLIQVVGFAALVVSQATQFAANHYFPIRFDSSAGVMGNTSNSQLLGATVWLSVLGFALAAIGYALQCASASDSRGGT